MSESERGREPGEPEMTQSEIRAIVRRVQKDLYIGPDSMRVVLARMDERLGNTTASLDERLDSTTTLLDERLKSTTASLDERLSNMATRMDERFSHTASREDIANLKISMIRWFLGSILTLAGIIVTTFKWLLP